MRLATLIIALADTALLLYFVSTTYTPGSGIDNVAGWGALLMFAVTAGPALVLWWRGKAPRAALNFALALPVLIAIGVMVRVMLMP
jgi:hypothetical protein